MTEQPHSPPHEPDAVASDGATPSSSRRLPGEPHPYMLQRNPPNLWILVWMTIFSLVMAAVVMALTVVL